MSSEPQDSDTLILKAIEDEASDRELQELNKRMLDDPALKKRFDEAWSAAEDVRFAVAVAKAEENAELEISQETIDKMEARFGPNPNPSPIESDAEETKVVQFPIMKLLYVAAALALLAAVFQILRPEPLLTKDEIATTFRDQATAQHMGPNEKDESDLVIHLRFEPGLPEIHDQRSLDQLAVVAAVMASDEFKATRFTVTNHSYDAAGPLENLDLSKERAQKVIEILVSDYQIAASRLEGVGKGAYEPESNDVKKNNRTVFRQGG